MLVRNAQEELSAHWIGCEARAPAAAAFVGFAAAITKARGFDMTLMFLGKEEKATLDGMLAAAPLVAHGVSAKTVAALRRKYGF